MRIQTKLLLLSLILGFAATECSDSDSSPDPSTNNNNTTADSGVVAEADAGFDDTPDAGFDAADAGFEPCRSDSLIVPDPPTCNAAYTAILRGTIEDQAGNPLDTQLGADNFPVAGPGSQVCIEQPNGPPKCLRPVQTCDGGYFEVTMVEDDRCIGAAVMRVFPYQPNFATSYCEVDFSSRTNSDFTISMPVTMYEIEAPTTLPPEGDRSAVRTVVFADGIEVDIQPERFFAFLDSYSEFRSRLIRPSDAAPCGTEAENFDGIVAFGPEGNVQSDGNGAGFPIRIPAGDLTQGTDVELFVLGGLDCTLNDGTLVKEGDWVRFGTATVDANGMIAGATLPCFNWLAWRAE